jgi:hypothetical protein
MSPSFRKQNYLQTGLVALRSSLAKQSATANALVLFLIFATNFTVNRCFSTARDNAHEIALHSRSRQIQIFQHEQILRTKDPGYFLPVFLPPLAQAPPAACAAFLAAFSCSALASRSRRCSGVSPSSRPLAAGRRACALCRSRSLWSPRAAQPRSRTKRNHHPKHVVPTENIKKQRVHHDIKEQRTAKPALTRIDRTTGTEKKTMCGQGYESL